MVRLFRKNMYSDCIKMSVVFALRGHYKQQNQINFVQPSVAAAAAPAPVVVAAAPVVKVAAPSPVVVAAAPSVPTVARALIDDALFHRKERVTPNGKKINHKSLHPDRNPNQLKKHLLATHPSQKPIQIVKNSISNISLSNYNR